MQMVNPFRWLKEQVTGHVTRALGSYEGAMARKATRTAKRIARGQRVGPRHAGIYTKRYADGRQVEAARRRDKEAKRG